ncbi:MAG: response regulator transcription factor [Rikenellaceae bacterium]
MAPRVHIVIAEPSVIIRSGVVALLQRSNSLNIDIAELEDIFSLRETLSRLEPDILIINPAHLGAFPAIILKEHSERMKIIALQSSLANQTTLKEYDGVINIYDSQNGIASTIANIINTGEIAETKNDLTQREKEIVICVAKGMTNKEIADELYISTHTVIAHRRNITSKLDIYSTSGLTIYAIVNKLIDLGETSAK